MASKWIIEFEGHVSDIWLRDVRGRQNRISGVFQKENNVIAREIEKELQEKIGSEVRVSIDFTLGSIDWNGIVEIVHHGITWMSDIGGAVMFIQLVRSTVSRVVGRHLPPSLPLPPRTRAKFIKGPIWGIFNGSAAPTERFMLLYMLIVNLILAIAVVAMSFQLNSK